MLIVIILIVVRTLPYELSVAVVRLLVETYLAASPRARSELDRAVTELGKGSFSAKEYKRQASVNIALMAKMGTGFSRRLEQRGKIFGEENIRGVNGGVVATFHFGPWELMAEAFTRRGFRVGALVSPQKIGVFNHYLAALRRRAGLQDLRTISQARAALADGVFLATLYDKTRRTKGQTLGVPYRDYSSSLMPARLSTLSRTPVIPVVCAFSGNRLEVNIGKPGEDVSAFFTPFFTRNPCQWLVWGE